MIELITLIGLTWLAERAIVTVIKVVDPMRNQRIK